MPEMTARRSSGSSVGRGLTMRPPTGVKSGSQTSSACSKSTRTGMPIRTSSGSTSTRFVVRRTSGCSSIDTQAMMYGSLPGIHCW